MVMRVGLFLGLSLVLFYSSSAKEKAVHPDQLASSDHQQHRNKQLHNYYPFDIKITTIEIQLCFFFFFFFCSVPIKL